MSVTNKKQLATVFAILAAALYAINVPLSKLLLEYVGTTMMAAYLYLGAGMGLMAVGLWQKASGKGQKQESLTKKELPYTIGMVVLDILAPIFLMLGIARTNSANASLLNNFEIVATSLIALLVFKEKISKLLWTAITLVVAASVLLSFEGAGAFVFNEGSLFVLLLGFVAYGLSIKLYIQAQSSLGAAKTSAFYSIAPFLGVAFSMLVLGERPGVRFYAGLVIMVISTILMVKDTLRDAA